MHSTRSNLRFLKTVLLPGCAFLLMSCNSIGRLAEHRADRAAYHNISEAQHLGLGGETPFSIKPDVNPAAELIEREEDQHVFSLADTLKVAISNSRAYQTRKEGLFIQALNLSGTEKEFNWNYNARINAQSEQSAFTNGTEETFGDNGLDSRATASMTRTLQTGARVSLDYSQQLQDYLTDPDESDFNNSVSFRVVQPLLNGFGALETLEPLRQAERDMIYAVRDFKRYEQDFIIDTTSRYYSTLRARDQLRNQRRNYESTVLNRKQTESYAKAGRIADFQAAEAMQSELDAADQWATAKASYESALDDFRYALGLPIDLNVIPDTNELTRLELRGLVKIDYDIADAVDSALSNRLDLINKRQQVIDQERKLAILQRGFLPELEATFNIERQIEPAGSEEEAQEIGLQFTLPFDWTEKRNRYRVAQISLEREIRDLKEDEDDVRRSVRDLWRTLERNRSIYENRLRSVKLSERRVENTQLLLKQGKARTRDLLDAEDDLLRSRNQATVSLVDYTINRLRFWNAIERFKISPTGMWYGQSADEKQETP